MSNVVNLSDYRPGSNVIPLKPVTRVTYNFDDDYKAALIRFARAMAGEEIDRPADSEGPAA